MDRNMKKALKNAFYAPAPTRKTAFLKQHRRWELNRRDFLLTQAGYIRWWVWGLSTLLFAAILMATARYEGQFYWFASALTPFLALLMVVENGRARFYGMEELELSCRTALRTAVLARMMILGLFHLVLLGTLTSVLAVWGAVGLFQVGLYLLTPYLLTASLGMELTRRCRGHEGLLACGGAAVLVSMAGVLPVYWRPDLYQQSALPLWGATLTVAVIAAAVEINLDFNKTGESQWN